MPKQLDLIFYNFGDTGYLALCQVYWVKMSLNIDVLKYFEKEKLKVEGTTFNL